MKGPYPQNVEAQIDVTGLAVSANQSYAAATGDKTLVAAQGAGKKIIVTSFILSSDTDTTYQFKTGSTALGPPIPVAARIPAGASFLPEPLIKTNANEALVINSSATITGGCWITYRVTTV